MMIQEYIIILIGAATLLIVGRRITKLFSKKSSPCGACTGCELSPKNPVSCDDKKFIENISR